MNSTEAIAVLLGADYQAVAALANTLGIAVEQLWECYARQAMVEGMSMIFAILFSGTCFGMWAKYVKKKVTKQEGQQRPDWDDDDCGCYLFLGGFIVSTIGFIIVCLSSKILTLLFNPDYWVITNIIKTLK